MAFYILRIIHEYLILFFSDVNNNRMIKIRFVT